VFIWKNSDNTSCANFLVVSGEILGVCLNKHGVKEFEFSPDKSYLVFLYNILELSELTTQ